MSTHIEIGCPKCHEKLRVRREYVGKRVTCKRCGETFKVWDPDEPLADLTSPHPAAEGAGAGALTSSLALAEALAERDDLRSKLARVRAQRDQLAAAARAQPALENVVADAVGPLQKEIEALRA